MNPVVQTIGKITLVSIFLLGKPFNIGCLFFNAMVILNQTLVVPLGVPKCLTRNQTVPFGSSVAGVPAPIGASCWCWDWLRALLDFFSSRLSHKEGYLHARILVHALLIQGLFVVKLFRVLPIDTRNVTPSRALRLSKDCVLRCCSRKCGVAG